MIVREGMQVFLCDEMNLLVNLINYRNNRCHFKSIGNNDSMTYCLSIFSFKKLVKHFLN